MKRYFFITFIILGFFISTAAVLAAGGGSGGSVPSCADLNVVADLETVIESKKQAFDAAKTNAERRRIILDVRESWQEFVHMEKIPFDANDNPDQAVKELNQVE